ncbi:MAG: hypothetical protein ACI4T1_01065 [Christensenellales bacterium]
MVKKKSFLTYLLAMFLIIPAFLMLSACGEKTFSYLDVKFSNQSSSIACHYGDNAGLGSFEITARFSDDSTETLSLQNVSVKIEFYEGHSSNPIELELSSYLEKIESNTLDVGTYTINFTYMGSTVSLTAEVYAVANTLDYELDLTTNVNSMGGKTITDNNVIFFGTKESAVNLIVKTNDEIVSNSQIDGLYILMKKVDGSEGMLEYYNVKNNMPDNLLTPQEYAEEYMLYNLSDDTYDHLSEITPGEYLICAKIKETNNFYATYSSFQKIEILKAPFTIVNEELTSDNYDTYGGLQYTWAFNVTKSVSKDVTFNDMLANEENNYYHTNDYFSSGEFYLILKAGQETAQETITLNNLGNGEEYENNLSQLLNYGNFVAVPFYSDSVVPSYNAQQNGEQLTAKVKFVPNEEYQNLYEESEPFLIKLTVNKGSYLIPRPTVSTNQYTYDSDSIMPSVLSFDYFDYTSQFFAEKTDSVTVSYKSENYNNMWQFSAIGAGTYTATIYFTGNDTANDIVNFYWEEDKYTPHGSTYTAEYVKKTIDSTEYIIGVKYTWDVQKEEFADLKSFIYNENGFSLQLNENGEAIIMFGLGPDAYYEGLRLSWSVLGKGVNLGEYGTTSATGTLTDVPGKEGNCRYKKFILNTNGLELNSSDYNIGFTITNVASDNFGTINAESIIVSLGGFSYYQDENSNICKSFYGTTTDDKTVYADYRLFTTGDTLQTVLHSLNEITGTNGSWTIKNADDTEISDYSTISLSNASKFKFVFTSSVCYIKNIGTDYGFIIHFFDHEPNANEFDIASE